MQNKLQYTAIETECVDCGQAFVIAPEEQVFFHNKGFELPKRCKECRIKRRQARQQQEEIKVKQKLAEDAHRKWEESEKELSALLPTLPYRQIELEALSIPYPTTELIIIGNGFDIMHCIQSSYRDFDKTIGKNSELRFHMETYLQCEDLWCNLEESLASLNAGAMLDTTDMWLNDFDAYDPDAQAADYHAAIDTAMLPIQVLTEQLPKRFRKWVESLTIDTSKKPLGNLISPDAAYLNFNYTECLEKIYGVPDNKIKYIHGCRKKIKGRKKDELILGHVPGIDYLKHYKPTRAMVPHYKSQRKAYLLESAMETGIHNWVNYYEETFTKKTSDIIQQNKAFFEQTASVKDIVVIGHSLSVVDYPYFLEIVKANAGKATWHIGYHSLDDLKRLIDFVINIGLEACKIEIFRT